MNATVTAARSAFQNYWLHRNALSEQASESVINLGMGSPSILFQQPPPSFRRAIQSHSADQATADYQQQVGEPSVRHAIAGAENRRLGADLYTASNVMLTHGALAGMDLADRYLCGDRPLVTFAPDYFNLVSNPRARLLQRQGTRISLSDVQALSSVDFSAVCLTNPNNPLGTFESPAVLDHLLSTCESRDAFLIVDETCDCMAVGSDSPAWRARSDKLIRVNGISKSLNGAGLRLGWILAGDEALGAIASAVPRSYGNVSLPVSRSYRDYLERRGEEDEACLMANTSRMLQARGYALSRVPRLAGCKLMAYPQASYYLTLAVDLPYSGAELSEMLLRDAGVDVVPGEFFGILQTAIRLCVARPREALAEGLGRLEDALLRLGGKAGKAS